MSSVAVYQSSRLKGIAAVAGCAAFAFLGTLMLDERPGLAWLVMLFFAGLACIGAYGVLAGGTRLRIGRKGFELADAFRTTRYRWDEIEALVPARIKGGRVIAVTYVPAAGRAGLSRAATGMDAAIPNAFGVPLEVLCTRLNDARTRYLETAAPSRTSEPARAGPLELAAGSPRAAPVVLLALGAAALVLVLNVVLRLVLKFEGMPVTMGIAFLVAGLVFMWFHHFARRAPSASERTRFLWVYGLLVVVPYLGLFLLGSARRGFNPAALVILALHALAYLAAAQMFLGERPFALGASRKA